MTKFSTLDNKKKEVKKTVFKITLGTDLQGLKTELTPYDYKNVLHLGYDIYYKDVFKCWNNDPNDFTIYFGEKGDEFDN